jgi:hypothetical protein
MEKSHLQTQVAFVSKPSAARQQNESGEAIAFL